MKPRILFVDDDQKVLQAIRRSLREMRESWEMTFASSGPEALELLASNDIDVIVSDIKMPGMSGIELLRQVREKYPDMIRIVLSGHYEDDDRVDGVTGEHQVLSKPCDKDVLVATITGTIEAKKLATLAEGGAAEELASGIKELTTSFFENGCVTAFEVPVSIKDDAARKALEALIPQCGRLLQEDGKLSVFLRVELGTEDAPQTRRVTITRSVG